MKSLLAQMALPVAGHPVIPVIFFENTWSISSLVVVSACCFSSSLPAVQPHASGLDILELVGRPVAGFKFCQYSFLALKMDWIRSSKHTEQKYWNKIIHKSYILYACFAIPCPDPRFCVHLKSTAPLGVFLRCFSLLVASNVAKFL